MAHPYAQQLSSAPGSLGEIKAEIQRVHGLKVTGGTYDALWRNLTVLFGEQGAALVVDDLVKLRKIRQVFGRLTRQKGIRLDAMLSEDTARAAKRGRGYLRQQAEAPRKPAQSRKKKRFDHSGLSLPPVEYMGARLVRTAGYAPLLVRNASGQAALRGRSDWLERHLENYMERNWAALDFGLFEHPTLIDRQVRLSDTQEKVDFLAGVGRLMVPVELKIKEARGSDLTQLQSYRQDLINRGFPEPSVLGVLVAPRFSSKVLNVVSGLPGIVLRWVDVPS